MKASSGILSILAVAALAAASPASARNACEQDKHDAKVTGSLLGALGGAFFGGAIAAHGHKGDGALLGAVGGAVVGNQLARSQAPCPDDYYSAYNAYPQRRGYAYPQPERAPVAYGYDAGYRSGYYAPPPPRPAYVYDGWRERRHYHYDDDGED
jgi:hypothetical protein